MRPRRPSERPAGEQSVNGHANTGGDQSGSSGLIETLSEAAAAARQPFRAKRLGYALWAVFGAWVVASIGGAIVAVAREGGQWELYAFVFLLPAVPLYYLARKFTAPTAIETLAADPRSPVLYLREFEADNDSFFKFWIVNAARFIGHADTDVTEESRCATLFNRIGPVVAIGRPGQVLPTLGASRLYVEHGRCQEVVARLAAVSALTVIRVGKPDDLWWEIEHAIGNLPPERLVLYLSGKTPEERKAAYEAFRERTRELLPKLGEIAGDPRFVAFDPSWRPYFMDEDARLLFDVRPPVYFVSIGGGGWNGKAGDERALTAVFSEIGPVVAFLVQDAAPPAGCSAWRRVEDPRAEIAGEASSNAPVILRARAEEAFGDLLSGLSAAINLRRLVIQMPDSAKDAAAVRGEIERALPDKTVPQLDKAGFIIFDDLGRPLTVGRPRYRRWSRSRWLFEKPTTAGRIAATDLDPFFERYGARAPGRKVARWAKIAAAVLLVIFAVAAIYEGARGNRMVAELESAYEVKNGWLGLMWGLPFELANLHYRHLDSIDERGPEVQSLSTDELVSVGGVEMPMSLVFMKSRLIGALLVKGYPKEGHFEALTGALTRVYGPPIPADGRWVWVRLPVVVRLERGQVELDSGERRYLRIVFMNESLAASLRSE